MPKVLVFSLALNGYHVVFDRCIRSHREYASRHGYEYSCITSIPGDHPSPAEAARIKIPLILSRLEAGFDRVFFVDADAEIKPDCPAIESIAVAWKSIYLVNGFSGKVNSGVMIVKNTPDALQFYRDVLDSCESLVPKEHQGLRENGHVIHMASVYPAMVQILDLRRNNTADPALQDYIRHYSDGGGMRKHYRGSVLWGLVSFGLKVLKKVRKKPGQHPFHTRIGLRKRVEELSRKLKW